jgi:hypothetical protein
MLKGAFQRKKKHNFLFNYLIELKVCLFPIKVDKH